MESPPPRTSSAPAFQLIDGLAAEDALGPIMQVMQQAFDPRYGEAWNHSQTRSMLALPLTHVLLLETIASELEESGEPVGFAMTRRVADEEELLLIAVAPKWRQFGAATILLGQVLENAREAGVSQLHLEMRSNNPAIRLYSKFGFQPIGLRKDYYIGTDSCRYDALTMAMALG
ncbi:ribosomal-protein-alanine N-acetyltransferase [Blastomonas natatoria]|uniref:Ribosomal-protein-alanine N-acetyltransferase n=1 Tax=Blastomonas natatoria TaxID=34015 RepID=A0A2V3V452_9SPHN|nr:GNAT family N-acetyltransferase [Blastomonas natatoria]PXW76447.1 ribosomal-protein-alanine N-acetyltransferase [Blastomonas natatoria]